MAEYGFSLIRIFSYKDRIEDSVFIGQYMGERNRLSGILYAGSIFTV